MVSLDLHLCSDPRSILVYPPSGRGSVNITKGDLARLAPGEYLNDTLIEFGLRLWLDDLRQVNPERIDEIYVFNSFFYKKLSDKKCEGYQDVRKWTAKVDIFSKKYLIIPVNEK
ncbi:hypothetical protein K488DRAFT_45060 [Vararia minispora EC-137]|uniref:Uncharacterized protein n=1 Tax=Vararia minispora EC-137 TaxID=1314806 RepID=A0ACB8QSI8_9AGAM|nr:hypothetical protein K488DRAFT_45060 [Vararia minispora EC-137]